MNRREFIRQSAISSGALALIEPSIEAAEDARPASSKAAPLAFTSRPGLPDLGSARWVWYPSGRCLQNTFILFRRALELPAQPKRARGWIAADSRYLLEVNGHRLQWGPPPADPRWPEADPVDLTAHLRAGQNVLGATVLFYGQGDGTWPIGKPGFLFWLELEHQDGRKEVVGSDARWQALLARAWRPGQYKRWYLRALQEQFDARLYPYGWTTAEFQPSVDWLPAMELNCPAHQPALASNYYEYLFDIGGSGARTELRARSIPLLREQEAPVQRLAEQGWLEWLRPPEDYFDFRVPGAYREQRQDCARETAPGEWEIQLDRSRGAIVTFELAEQVVGWPHWTIEAPAGTTLELLVHEAHRLGGPMLLNTHFDSWTRFICREGVNRFEPFDFESCRWLQLHLHPGTGVARIRDVGVRRRLFPWPHTPHIACTEGPLQRLFDATINTLHNCAQETCVDGMARERQQYSGDGAHQLHAIHLAFGENRLPARFLTTFSQGLTQDGFFLDCWPAYDRLARLVERQLQLTGWGPILDHGVGFGFDCWHYYLYTGDREALREPYPRLLRFAEYLRSRVGREGLLPVEDLGIPSVWIDHVAYRRQRHKQCAFNLYAAAMLRHALAPISRVFGDESQARALEALGQEVWAAVVRKFWSRERGLFVNNLPWLAEEKESRLCDRSLATAMLFDQCPNGRTQAALEALVNCPAEMGFSYPANACWRLWALAKGGRADIVVKDLRERWAPMDSVRLNLTLQEDWQAAPDSGQQWSHCAVAPLFLAHMSLAGIRPLAPGFKRLELWPQLADLEGLSLTTFTVQGPIRFGARGKRGDRELSLEAPAACEAELVLRREETVTLDRLEGAAPHDHLRFRLPAGKPVTLRLKFT